MGKAAEEAWKVSHTPFSAGPQQQQKYVPLLGLGWEKQRREAAQLGPGKAVSEENHGRKNRELSETDPKAPDSHSPGEKKHPCRAVG